MYHDRQLKLLLLAGVASMRDNTAFSRIYLVSNNSLQRRIKISPSSFKSHEMELPLSRFLILRVNIFNQPHIRERRKDSYTFLYNRYQIIPPHRPKISPRIFPLFFPSRTSETLIKSKDSFSPRKDNNFAMGTQRKG